MEFNNGASNIECVIARIAWFVRSLVFIIVQIDRQTVCLFLGEDEDHNYTLNTEAVILNMACCGWI